MGSEFSQKVLAVLYGGATFVLPTFVPPTFFPQTFVPQDICKITILVPPLTNKRHLCHHGEADRWTDRQWGVREQSPLLRDESTACYKSCGIVLYQIEDGFAVPDGEEIPPPLKDEEY